MGVDVGAGHSQLPGPTKLKKKMKALFLVAAVPYGDQGRRDARSRARARQDNTPCRQRRWWRERAKKGGGGLGLEGGSPAYEE